MLRLLKNAWIHTLIALDVRDPLKSTGKVYELPENFTQLDPQGKARATVCNLSGTGNELGWVVTRFTFPRVEDPL